MNPNSGEYSKEPEFQAEFPQPAEGLERRQEKALERQSDSESAAGKAQPQDDATTALPITLDLPDTTPVVIPGDAATTQKPSVSSSLGNQEYENLIDQSVRDAKTVITQTSDDPYNQKIELSKIQAEVLRRGFNKTIPTEPQ